MRHCLIASLGILVVLIMAGCSTAPSVKPTPASSAPGAPIKQRVSVDGGDVYEDCFELKTGQSMHYEFRADGELRFNLHWHNDADTVEYAVDKVGVTSDKGMYTSDIDEYYCLMWRNDGHMPVSLSLTLTIN